MQWGFRRKDHWLKHLRVDRGASKNEMKDFQEKGIPMAVMKEGVWSLFLRKAVERLVYDEVGSYNIENTN